MIDDVASSVYGSCTGAGFFFSPSLFLPSPVPTIIQYSMQNEVCTPGTLGGDDTLPRGRCLCSHDTRDRTTWRRAGPRLSLLSPRQHASETPHGPYEEESRHSTAILQGTLRQRIETRRVTKHFFNNRPRRIADGDRVLRAL